MNWNPIECLKKHYDTDANGLMARKGFFALDAEQKKDVCNGMGSKSTWWNRLLYWFIPNKFFGLNMAPIGDRHDFGYTLGGSRWMKMVEDTVFLVNMIIWIWLAGTHHRKKRLWLAFQYYVAVLLGGKASYTYREVAP